MRDLNSRLFKIIMAIAVMSLVLARPAMADYVGEMETTKFFDAATIALIQSKLPGGLLAGDQVSYIIQFTPTDNGGAIGGGGYVTDYIPANTIVTNAQFIRLNPDGSFTQIDPPTPGAVTPAYVPLYSDTGIFYSTDARTAMYTTPIGTPLSQSNGYNLAVQNPGCTGVSLPSSTHNAWDNSMVTAFAGANGMTGGTCAAPPAISTYSSTTNGGLSPVAGPDTYLTLDYTGAVGPWQRIKYQGSKKGIGTPVAGINAGSCVGGAPTTAGWDFATQGPLPAATKAVRFAAGKVVVGELFTARITLQLQANLPASGIINNTEVFGGDASLDVGNAAAHPSTWNQWRYFCPAVAVSNSNLMVLKTLVGTCIGTGCTPTAVTAGVVPNAANLKLRYQVQYLNTGITAQTNVVLTDTLATGAAFITGTAKQLSNGAALIPTPAGNPVVLTFPVITPLAPGAGDTVQYDVNVATAQADGTALVNTARLVSTQVPSPGVTSRAIATVSSQANLWIGKTVSPSVVASGGSVAPTVTYTITIPNNGGTAVVASSTLPITVNDYLPTDGLSTSTADRFTYSGLVSAATYTAAGVATTVTPTVTDVAPATVGANETVTFKLTSGTIPVGGKLVITFNAAVGLNVPAQTAPYVNNANVFYSYGPGGTGANSSMSETIGTAPVTVSSVLSLTKKVNCVYTPVTSATCVPYTGGAVPTGSKIKYQLDYKNISGSPLSNVAVTDTLPANTSFVSNSASTAAQPTVAGQVLNFSSIASLAASAIGTITFDVDASAVATGTDITNVAKITATGYSAGIQASVTSSVRDQVLQIIKTVSPASVQPGGVVTYSITVRNLSTTATASAIQIYDELPYDTTVTTANSASEFNYLAAGTFANNDTVTAAGNKVVAVTPPTRSAVPPIFPGYSGFANQQEVYWNFGSTKQLAPGMSFTFTYTATAGSAIPASTKIYTSDVNAQYTAATLAMTTSVYGVAGVTIGGLDHIFIQHNLTGLTCLPETLTVIACGNPACTTQYTGTVTATLNGIGAISFSGGSTTTSLAVTTPIAFTLGATSISPAPQAATNCTSPTCTLTFSDAGLILSSAANGAQVTVPNQVAGVASSQYVVRAVKSDKITGACTSALTGTQSVNFGYECNDPTSCAAGNLLSINGVPVVANNNNPLLGYSYAGINLTFDANGNAITTPISFSYEDVGQVTLRMQKTMSGANLQGSSNSFIVKPHHIAVDVCAGASVCALGTAATPINGTGAVLAVAGTASTQTGTAFSATVRSMSANNNVTPSFGTAGSANGGTSPTTETVTLTQSCVAPIIAPATTCPNSGTLNGTMSITRSAFNSGVATVSDLTWSEVGVISLTATNGSFMGGGSSVGTSNAAGRFRPDHFDTVVAGQMACGNGLTCPAGGMVYSGQVFNSVAVQARNAAMTLTVNYQGAFAKAVNLSAVGPTGGASIAATIGTLGGTTTVPLTAFSGGSGSLTGVLPANTGAPWFSFTATPTAPTNIFMRALENAGDNVTSLRPVGTSSVESGVTVVSGWVKVSNAYGSELLPLTVTAMAQYYSSTGWVKSLTDSITALTLTSPITLNTGGKTVVTPTSGTLTAGILNFILSKPGVPGVATIDSTVLTAPSYLPLIQGTATFGIYNGNNNNIIYKRESY